jgi:hypothetical protein
MLLRPSIPPPVCAVKFGTLSCGVLNILPVIEPCTVRSSRLKLLWQYCTVQHINYVLLVPSHHSEIYRRLFDQPSNPNEPAASLPVRLFHKLMTPIF